MDMPFGLGFQHVKDRGQSLVLYLDRGRRRFRFLRACRYGQGHHIPAKIHFLIAKDRLVGGEDTIGVFARHVRGGDYTGYPGQGLGGGGIHGEDPGMGVFRPNR